MSQNDSEGEGNRPACSACRHQRKKCKEDCILWRHFPPSMMQEFKTVHKIFGISNISKMIRELDPIQQDQAVKSFLWEADSWKEDPVHGPLGRLGRLEQEIRNLRNQMNIMQHQLMATTVAPPNSNSNSFRNFSYRPDYPRPNRMNHGYIIPVPPNFSPVNFNHPINFPGQDVTSMLPYRPQQHIGPRYNSNISFEQTNNRVMNNNNSNNPCPSNVRINNNGGDFRSMMNNIGESSASNNDHIVGPQNGDNNRVGELASIYYGHHQQHLSNTDQNNNIQDQRTQSEYKALEGSTWKKN